MTLVWSLSMTEPATSGQYSLPNLHPVIQLGVGVIASYLGVMLAYVLGMAWSYSWLIILPVGIVIGAMGPWAFVGAIVIAYHLSESGTAFGGMGFAVALLVLGALIGLAIRTRELGKITNLE